MAEEGYLAAQSAGFWVGPSRALSTVTEYRDGDCAVRKGPRRPEMTKTRQTQLTVRCAFCAWDRRGRKTAMLAAQHQHRRKHVTQGGPR